MNSIDEESINSPMSALESNLGSEASLMIKSDARKRIRK
jgi:hypothetical protein